MNLIETFHFIDNKSKVRSKNYIKITIQKFLRKKNTVNDLRKIQI